MAGRVVVRLDKSKINPFLASVSDLSARRAAERTRDRARANMAAAGRVRTGKGARSITARKVRSDATGTSYDVGSPLAYVRYQEEGIGPVVARPGKVLAFKPKNSSVTIFRPRTKGFPGAHFLRDAYRRLTLSDFTK